MEICGVIGPFQIIILLSFLFVFFGLTIFAVIDILRNEFTENNKLIWILVVLFLGPIGAVIYLALGNQHKIRH
jgi:hypothetical protein